jgi:hypothetical protein
MGCVLARDDVLFSVMCCCHIAGCWVLVCASADMNAPAGMNAREQDKLALLYVCLWKLRHTERARETQRTSLC